jgi:hypothetical protein
MIDHIMNNNFFKTIPGKGFAILLAFLLSCSGGINSQSITMDQNIELLKAGQGTGVKLPGFLNEKHQHIDYQKIILPGPQYIISDDPEYIRVPEAVAVRESVRPGTVRLYLYNVNGIQEPTKIDRKISAVIKNTGTEDMHMRMLKYSSQKPSSNYYQIAKSGLTDYFSSMPQKNPVVIKPGAVAAIDEQLEKNIVKYDELAHGIYEFVIDQPGEVSVIQTDPDSSAASAASRIRIVHPSSNVNAGRGMFGISNYMVVAKDTLRTSEPASSLIVADGKLDPWINGVDGSNGRIIDLDGNYGVMYDIELNWESTDGKGLALITWNALSGGQWCGGMANVMKVSEGKFKEGIIQIPSDKLITTGYPEAVLIQIFLPDPKNRIQTIRFTYSPPGASCLPVPFIFIPVQL